MNAGERIIITDVSPRDGLQNQTQIIPTSAKLALIERLVAAGVQSIEATSFVSPRAVPQMADAADIIAGCAPSTGIRISALVPNMKGLERARACGTTEIAVVLSATETMNQRNINMSLAEATDTCTEVLHAAHAAGLRTRAYIAVAIECPFEGLTPPARVTQLARLMQAANADEIILADTIGAGVPSQVETLLSELGAHVPMERIGVHFHDTRGMGVANAWTAIRHGVRRLDASMGGVGGCPFAPGAAGNVATEDIVLLAEQSGFDTGIDLDALVEVIGYAESVLGYPLGGRSSAWLRRSRNPS